ncbi:MAG: homoserine dehydrogenase [Eubacteriaceae bacterium]
MKIGLLGLGTVGSGVYEIINHQKGNYFANSKEEALITKVLVRDIKKKRNIDIPINLLVEDYNEILEDNEIEVVIFVMGGMEPEYSYMLQAMKKGKNVITANKEVVSEHMDKLINTAKENNVSFLFEASVGGGIPIITSLNQTLRINQIDEIKGILNGTTNFILTKMTEEGWSFKDTLKKAQDMGFAEADPTADIEGYDMSRKLSILSSMAYGSHLKDKNMYRRGIKGVKKFDIDMFKDLGFVLKYLAHSKINGHKYYATVEPVLLSIKNIMSNVNEEYNIVSLNGNIIGELQFYGKGAGKNATANAVVGDLLYIINNDFKNQEVLLEKELTYSGVSEFSGKYYLRADINDHNDFVNIIDLIDEYSKKKKIIFNSSNFIVITEKINAEVFNELVVKLEDAKISVFYARIYS